MFCQNCGTQVQPGQSYCTGCARPLTGYAPSQENRLARHVDLLGIFWIAYSSLSLIGGIVVWVVAQVIFGHSGRFDNGAPEFLHPLLLGVALYLLFKSAVGIGAGIGLRQRAPWARVLAIILGFLEILHLPLGTGLGIYTIWTLLSPNAEREYQSFPQTA